MLGAELLSSASTAGADVLSRVAKTWQVLLPAIVSVTLSAGARAMAQRGVIVRRLEAIENLGSMDVLCTDKTGTLTQGEIALTAAVDVTGQPLHVFGPRIVNPLRSIATSLAVTEIAVVFAVATTRFPVSR